MQGRAGDPGTVPALGGLTIVDLSRVLAGPYATMMLADFGARVIKVERPGVGDETRAWIPPADSEGRSTYFASVNRNKEGITADLADDGDRERLRELLRDADVLVENFRAGTLERLGFGYEELRKLNPRLIYCSITGFGSAGGAALPGFDLLVQAVGGLMSITGPRPGEPTKTGVAVVDVLAGLHAVTGILTAVIARERTGTGQRVEVNLLSSLLSGLVNQAGSYLQAGVVPGILGNAHPSIAPYELFETADRPLAVAVGTDHQFRALAAALGAPGLADDPRFRTNERRVEHRAELAAVLTERLAGARAGEWSAILAAVGVPAGPINTLDEAFALAERLGLAPVVDVHGSRQVANPVTLSDTPAQYRLAPPALADASLPKSSAAASSAAHPPLDDRTTR
ncbi:MAG: sle [Naasia sp.]|jgi:crotonobetainyl-CoA:carnitine CoA-transferase CaiB-like acyl-CoA transferase|uniref:CaiB/BaiF CoA transferase family protein n=1 Tax=Naasia sp. TaxID=2546198 RepID=UPI002618C09A|nr:CoA transferase [Naasia sp.]MCU1570345.1 sle [Naasia sp.]